MASTTKNKNYLRDKIKASLQIITPSHIMTKRSIKQKIFRAAEIKMV